MVKMRTTFLQSILRTLLHGETLHKMSIYLHHVHPTPTPTTRPCITAHKLTQLDLPTILEADGEIQEVERAI